VSQANLTKTERIIDLPSANAPSLVKDPSNATAQALPCSVRLAAVATAK